MTDSNTFSGLKRLDGKKHLNCKQINLCQATILGLWIESLDVTFHCFVSQVIDAQQAERTTGSDVTEEEPHPYTISFFLFPHKQTVDLIGGKGNKTQHDKTKLNSPQGN